MDEKRTTIITQADDRRRASRLQKKLAKRQGKVTFSSLVRQALIALEEKLT